MEWKRNEFWSIMTVAITLLFVFTASAMLVNAESPETGEQFITGTESYPFVVDVATDTDRYHIGDPVNIIITVANSGPDTTLVFSDGQHADFEITNEIGQHIYLWSHDMAFIQAITRIPVEQGETKVLLNDIWNQVDDDGNPVPPGKYYIDGWMVSGYNSHPEIHGRIQTIEIDPAAVPTFIRSNDTDGDGVPDVWDMDNSTPTGYWTDPQGIGRRWGDMNGDGELTSVDALMILQAVVGKISL
jgi:hypothetical protein